MSSERFTDNIEEGNHTDIERYANEDTLRVQMDNNKKNNTVNNPIN